MALSFGESKRLAAKKAASPANVSVDDIDVATLELNDEDQIAVYDDNGEETFERSGNYTWFADYSDDQWSYIDKNKDIQIRSISHRNPTRRLFRLKCRVTMMVLTCFR